MMMRIEASKTSVLHHENVQHLMSKQPYLAPSPWKATQHCTKCTTLQNTKHEINNCKTAVYSSQSSFFCVPVATIIQILIPCNASNVSSSVKAPQS